MIFQWAGDDEPEFSCMKSKALIALATGSPLFELALVLVRLNHVASFIVNVDQRHLF